MKKIFTLLVMCLCVASMAWADEETIDLTTQGYDNQQEVTTVTGTKATLTFNIGTGKNAPKYYTTGTAVRLYGGGTLTISATETISKIVFTFDTYKDNAYVPTASNCTVNTGSYDPDSRTWTGSATSITLTNTATGGHFRFQKLVITYGNGGTETVSAPAFSHPAGTYYTPFELSMSTSSAGASIYYTTSGDEPTASSTLYTSPITISANTTVKAIAVKGSLTSAVTTAVYELGTATDVANIAAYQAADSGTVVRFTSPVNVLAQNGNNLYVKDATGYAYLYGSIAQKYKNGDVIPAGFTGTRTKHNGEPELSVSTTSNFKAASGNSPIEPEVIQVSDVAADYFAHYVLIKGANTSFAHKTITDNSGTASCYTSMGGFSAKGDSVNVSVYGIIGSYGKTNTVYQVLPTKIVGATVGVDNIAAFKALADSTVSAIKGDVSVYYASGSNLYVKDATGYMCIFGTTGQSYKNGDVIPGGFSGTKVTYNDGPEMKAPLEGFQPAKSNSPIAPDAATTAIVTAANWGHYVKLSNVTLSAVNGKNLTVTDAAGSAAAYNSFGVSLPTDLTAAYDLTAIVSSHNGKAQLLVTAITLAGGGTIALPEVENLAGLYALNSGVNAKLTKPITTIYQNGRDLYVKDSAGTYGLVYGQVTNTFANGDQITGAVMNWSSYNGIKELTPVDSTMVKSGDGTPVGPEEMALEDVSQDLVHHYIIVKNATLVADTDKANTYIINDGTIEMKLFNKYSKTLAMPAQPSGTYDVKCFVSLYTNNSVTTLELVPVEVKSTSALKGDIDGDGKVNVTDVTALINGILGQNPVDTATGDLNADGKVNVTDVTALINIILSNN